MFLPDRSAFQANTPGGQTDLIILRNSQGSVASFCNYGARWVNMLLKDRHGNFRDVVLGFDSIEEYVQASDQSHGAIMGRYANRIAFGKLQIAGHVFQLETNIPPHHLHGASAGFQLKCWEIGPVTGNSVTFFLQSADQDGHFPGNLQVSVTYTLSEENEVLIDLKATTDKPTVLNLCNHAYFNLNGIGAGNILDHTLTIDADAITETDQLLIPTGHLMPVTGTPFDFRAPRRIGERIDVDDQAIRSGKGYDHNYVLNKRDHATQASARGELSGITMEVHTTEPGIQLYTANHFQGENILRGGFPDKYREGFCLETQHFPDSPNHPDFPSTLLMPGEVFTSHTGYRFNIS